jgi:hypothetical protein
MYINIYIVCTCYTNELFFFFFCRFFLMHQPPTIPEGDEENEGVEQRGEGTRFPHTGAQQQQQQQPPPLPLIHDTTATAAELQPREDEGAGYGQTPTLQNEMIAVSGDVTTDAPQQAEYDQPSSVEKPIIDDEATVGAPSATDAENEIQGQLDERGALAGITDEEGVINELTVEADAEKLLQTMEKSPRPSGEETLGTSPRAVPTEEQIKSDESMLDSVS